MSTPTPQTSFTVRPIEAHETHDLRHRVLRPGRPDDVYFAEDAREEAFHAGAQDGTGRIIAIASVYHEGRAEDPSGTSWRIRGMASDPDVRGTGAGRAVLEACLDHVRTQGGTVVWCNARTGAIGFYERLGWTVRSEEFDIPTVGPHVVMDRALS